MIIFHTMPKIPAKDRNKRLWYEYFYTATGRRPPKGFKIRVSTPEDPLVRIYEQVVCKARNDPLIPL